MIRILQRLYSPRKQPQKALGGRMRVWLGFHLLDQLVTVLSSGRRSESIEEYFDTVSEIVTCEG